MTKALAIDQKLHGLTEKTLALYEYRDWSSNPNVVQA